MERAMRKEQDDGDEDGDDKRSEAPEFDAEGWYQQFDDEFPPIEIPDEVVEDVDNDFNITIEDLPADE